MTNVEHSDYVYEVDMDSNSAAARVIRMVGKNKNVLEIGAGPGSITKYLYKPGHCKIHAIEIDQDSIKKLSNYCECVYNLDLNDEKWPDNINSKINFDVIVAADVLEHLYDPWSTLKLMKSLINKGGYLVISIPHISHNAIIACLLNGNFEYRDWGLLDRTHIRFFGLKNIQSLFESAGLSIEEAQFVITPPEETEFSKQWQMLPISMKRALSSHEHGQIYQVVIKAVPEDRLNKGINLTELPVPKPVINLKDRLKSILRPFIPQKIRAILR